MTWGGDFSYFNSTTNHKIIQIKNHNLLCSLDPPNSRVGIAGIPPLSSHKTNVYFNPDRDKNLKTNGCKMFQEIRKIGENKKIIKDLMVLISNKF